MERLFSFGVGAHSMLCNTKYSTEYTQCIDCLRWIFGRVSTLAKLPFCYAVSSAAFWLSLHLSFHLPCQ